MTISETHDNILGQLVCGTQCCCLSTGLLLRQLHRLGEQAQDDPGHSAKDVEKDIRQSLVTVFNSRPDMCGPPDFSCPSCSYKCVIPKQRHCLIVA